MARKTYDPDCYALAAGFLSDEPQINTVANCDELATEIQQAIEGFIEDKNRARTLPPHTRQRHGIRAG